jgi:hypothetical protein
VNFYSESNKTLKKLRSIREVRTPVSIPIQMLYDEIIKQCQEKKTIRAKDELDVILIKMFICIFKKNLNI